MYKSDTVFCFSFFMFSACVFMFVLQKLVSIAFACNPDYMLPVSGISRDSCSRLGAWVLKQLRCRETNDWYPLRNILMGFRCYKVTYKSSFYAKTFPIVAFQWYIKSDTEIWLNSYLKLLDMDIIHCSYFFLCISIAINDLFWWVGKRWVSCPISVTES